MFSRPTATQDWQNIKLMITQYFAQKAVDEANRIWDTENWNDEKVNELLNTHLRTPYQKP